MFRTGFQEALNKSAELPEDDPQAFDCFLRWLYAGTLPLIDMAKSFPTSGPLWDRIKLYYFKEKYCIDILVTPSSMLSSPHSRTSLATPAPNVW
jgi:hypothetical protein